MDFLTGFLLSTDWKRDSYDVIFVIVDRLTKIVYYKSVKTIVDTAGLRKIIINVVVWHHSFFQSIVNDQGLLFSSKFWFLICHFLTIKQKPFTAFHLQIDGPTERQKSTMKAYLGAFVKHGQNNKARLLPMTKFAYNNAKNTSIGYISFELTVRA